MCEKWRLPLRIEKVYVNRQSPAGIEAAAREARYQTLKRIAHETNSDVIMTGHHLDDRIETFFIQWMRGAGPEGLSAMSPVRTMESAALTERLVLSRPWLDVARSEIESYVKRRGSRLSRTTVTPTTVFYVTSSATKSFRNWMP